MASHIWLASQSAHKPNHPAEIEEFLAGAIAPDVRYLQPNLKREDTHSDEVAMSLNGPFGRGYRHHLAVDRYFYERCRHGFPKRLGALNCSILLELYALRHLPAAVALPRSHDMSALTQFGVDPSAALQFMEGCATYIESRDPDAAIEMMSSALKERADRYLRR